MAVFAPVLHVDARVVCSGSIEDGGHVGRCGRIVNDAQLPVRIQLRPYRLDGFEQG